MAEATADDVSTDAFLGGRLLLRQPKKGHRAGTDAILLAAAVPSSFAGVVYDVGAGVGAAGLALASRCPGASVRLIENDAATIEVATANIAANPSLRASLVEIDVLTKSERRGALREERADLVMTNPPFYDPASFRLSPDARRRTAHVMVAGDLGGWLDACLDLLGPKGSLVVIHRAEAARTMMSALDHTIGGLTLLPVYPRAGEDATRVLIRAVKGSRAPARIAAALVLHEDDGRFTAAAERLHRGEASLPW